MNKTRIAILAAISGILMFFVVACGGYDDSEYNPNTPDSNSGYSVY